MSSLREALLEYHNSLEELTFNSKPIISMLTMVAAEFAEIPDGPPNVVEIIFKRVEAVDIKQKLPVLYLIDSICKNIGKPFTELFEKKIVDTFKHVFEEGDETTRASLYKLRKTWIGIFSDNHLHQIDSAAQSIDPAWPSIPNSGPPPKRRKENLDSTSSAGKVKGPTAVSANSSILTSRRKQAAKPIPSTVSTINRKPNVPESTKKALPATISKSNHSANAFGTQDRDYRKEKRLDGLTTVPPQSQIPTQAQAVILPPAQIMATIQPTQVPIGVALPLPIQAPIPAPLPAISNFASSLSQPTIKPPESIPQLSKDIGQQYVQVDGNTVKLFFLDENTSIVLMKGSPHLSLNELVKTNPYDLEPRLIMFEGKPTKVYIDSDKGSKEFVCLNFNSQPQTFFNGEHAQRIKLGGPCREIILNGKPYQASFGGPPIDVKFLGDTHQTHTLRLGGPPPRVKISDDLRVDLWTEYVKKITGQSDENPISAETTYPSLIPPSTQLPYPPSILGTPPSSSLLLPPVTSPLVQPSLTTPGLAPPGLVTNPTVAIASTLPATVLPANVSATLNTLQSSLPVTLPLQVPVPASGSNLTSTAPVPSTEPEVNVGDLLNKLMSAGLFIRPTEPQITDSLTTSITTSTVSSNVSTATIGSPAPLSSVLTNTTTTTTTAAESTSTTTLAPTVTRTDSPSVLIRENGVNSLDEIESEPLLLETKSLKADHPKIIADLINGTQCPNCSLRFEVGDSNERSKYSVHLDWHFRLNRQERTDSKSKSAAVRRWFCPLDLWVSFKEITDETDETNLDTEKEENDSGGEKKVCTVSANEDENLNECAVCKERFETTWNEDEEEWQLLNAVKGQDEKIYHPLCLEDLLKQRAAAVAAAEAAAVAAAEAAAKEDKIKAETTETPSVNGQDDDKPTEVDNRDAINVKTEDGQEGEGIEGGDNEIKEEEDIKEEDVNEDKIVDEDEDEDDSSDDSSGEEDENARNNSNGNENENENDEDDVMIDEDYILHPPETKGQLEVSVCCIS